MKIKTYDKDFIINFISEIFKEVDETFNGIYSLEDFFCCGKNKTKISIEDGIFKDLSYRVECGASKLCFIFDELDYVIKIPIIGEAYFYNEDTKIYCETYYCEGYNNYIENEMDFDLSNIQQEICLENIFVGTVSEMPIYIQKKAISYYDFIMQKNKKVENKEEINESKKELLSKIKKCHDFPHFEDGFLLDILKLHPEWGVDEISELFFEDMRTDNYGYLENGEPVIFDYVGFNEC